MEPLKTYGQILKALRERHGWSLRQFCRDHGFDSGNWSKRESGEHYPPMSVARVRAEIAVFKPTKFEEDSAILAAYSQHKERLRKRFEINRPPTPNEEDEK